MHVIPRPHSELDGMIVNVHPLATEDTPEEPEGESGADTDPVEEETVTPVEEAKAVDETETVEKIEESLRSKRPLLRHLLKRLLLWWRTPARKSLIKTVWIPGLRSLELIRAMAKLKAMAVVKLRRLAREYKTFGIAGRAISKADKGILISYFAHIMKLMINNFGYIERRNQNGEL